MDIIKLKRSFPLTIPFPVEINALCEWINDHSYPVSGCFELRTDDYGAITSWFGNDEASDKFAVFGASSDGGLYCLWNYEGTFPIVYLDSEGEGNRVLAKDIKNFIRLLMIGYEEVGIDDLDVPPKKVI